MRKSWRQQWHDMDVHQRYDLGMVMALFLVPGFVVLVLMVAVTLMEVVS